MEQDLLREIHEFLARSKMSPSYFGKAACNNSELVGRLEDGKTITFATAAKARAFIRERDAVGAA